MTPFQYTTNSLDSASMVCLVASAGEDEPQSPEQTRRAMIPLQLPHSEAYDSAAPAADASRKLHSTHILDRRRSGFVSLTSARIRENASIADASTSA